MTDPVAGPGAGLVTGLEGRGLWLRYGRDEPWVLRDVAVTVRPGRVVGLWGPSGSGKSTLAAVLAGLRRPARGTVTVDGQLLAGVRGPRPVQLVLQRPELAMNPRWKIRQVLAEADPEGPELASGPDGLVEPDWLDRYPHEISGGELQRVNLARALLVRPRYLLADEMSSSLDALTQARLWHRVLDEVRSRGTGVLAVSHDRALLERVGDVVVEVADLAGHTRGASDGRRPLAG